MKKTLGFIGYGHIANAIIGGILSSEISNKYNIIASAAHKKTINGITTTSNIEVVKNADIVFLAVKPNVVPIVLSELSNEFSCCQTLISLTAGISRDYIKSYLSDDIKVVRTMPNTPIEVNAGMTALSGDIDDEILTIFRSFGKAEVIPEENMDIATAISGSAPAYMYLFIDSMVKAAEKLGMDSKLAEIFATQTMLGSAKMVEKFSNPGDLCEKVCTPGGTTIEAVKVLKNGNLEDIMYEGMKACADRSAELSK